MEQGFSDACVALCMDQQPVGRVAQTCRAAAIEMPRPTVRRWCEHGYNVAFSKTVKDLATYFRSASPPVEDAPFEPEAAEERQGAPVEAQPAPEVYSHDNTASAASGDGDRRAILATIPVTLDDAVTKDLIVHEGENAEEAVVLFCRMNVGEDEMSSCIRQLLNVVLDKLAA